MVLSRERVSINAVCYHTPGERSAIRYHQFKTRRQFQYLENEAGSIVKNDQRSLSEHQPRISTDPGFLISIKVEKSINQQVQLDEKQVTIYATSSKYIIFIQVEYLPSKRRVAGQGPAGGAKNEKIFYYQKTHKQLAFMFW